MMNNCNMVNITIIGAGIAGLTAAIALKQAGFNVKVLERAKALHNIGGGLFIWPNGVKALNALGMGKELEKLSDNLQFYEFRDSHGETLLLENVAVFNEANEGKIMAVSRSDLQWTLANYLGKDHIEFDTDCIDIIANQNEWQIHTSDEKIHTAHLIVDASGIRSKIREKIFPGAKLIYTGLGWWGGILEPAFKEIFPAHSVLIQYGDGKIFWTWPLSEKRQSWFVVKRMPQNTLIKDEYFVEQFKNICSNWSGMVDDFLTLPQIYSNSFKTEVFSIAPQPRWVGERFVLLGDSAHAIGPVIGQGACHAIEDAVTLAKSLLNNFPNLQNGLLRYEQIRVPAGKEIFNLENSRSLVLVSENKEIIEQRNSSLKNNKLRTVLSYMEQLIHARSAISSLSAEDTFFSYHP